MGLRKRIEGCSLRNSQLTHYRRSKVAVVEYYVRGFSCAAVTLLLELLSKSRVLQGVRSMSVVADGKYTCSSH